MYLSLVRNNFFLLILIISIPLNAEIISSTGISFHPNNMSDEECNYLAEKDDIKKIFENAGLAYINIFENLNCSDSELIDNKSKCEYFQESQFYTEGGFITDKVFTNQEIINPGDINRKCSVKLSANVEKYKSKQDINFILHAKMNKNIFVYRSSEEIKSDEIIINGQINLPTNYEFSFANIYLFNFNIENDTYSLIFPNTFDKENKIRNGKFQIPSNEGINKYGLYPTEMKDDIVQEHVMLLATKESKKAIEFMETESSVSLNKRLNDFGRENWQKIRLSYVFVKE